MHKAVMNGNIGKVNREQVQKRRDKQYDYLRHRMIEEEVVHEDPQDLDRISKSSLLAALCFNKEGDREVKRLSR